MSEIYGLSETSGPMTWTPFRVHVGTVGPPIPGCEVVLADDGEVSARGGNIFRGYLNDPERTAEALDDDGWLHTGDIGEFDDDGYLKIVDRKKELIITAGGKNISPANLEAALKSFPLIGQACVIGDNRPLHHGAARARSGGRATVGREPRHRGQVARRARGRSDRARRGAAQRRRGEQRFPRVEQIKKFVLLGEEWLPDSEELTPTMKLKRRGVHTKYADQIEGMYAP